MRRRALALAAGGAVALSGAALPSAVAQAGGRSSIRVDETANLAYRSSGSRGILEQGQATGTVNCTLRATLRLSGVHVSSSFNATASSGSFGGTAYATITSTSGRYDSFSGTVRLTHGRGRFAHVGGTGRVSGQFDRKSLAVTLHMTGTFST